MGIYNVLDWFFTLFHTLLIIFNMTGWIWKRVRKLNLAALVITAGSWFILGIFYGIGYCPLTDWHWQVLRRLGERGLPASYTQYLIDRITGIELTSTQADFLTAGGLAVALIISIILNIRDYRIKKKGSES